MKKRLEAILFLLDEATADDIDEENKRNFYEAEKNVRFVLEKYEQFGEAVYSE